MADDVAQSVDLGYLRTSPPKKTGGKSAFQVRPPQDNIPKAANSSAERELSLNRTGKKESTTMRKVKVKHNSLRNRALSVDGVVFHFDASGFCQVPEAHMEALRLYMRRSPGRITVVEEATRAPSLDELQRRAEAALTAHQAKLEQEVSAMLDKVDQSITEPPADPAEVDDEAVEKKPPTKRKKEK